MANEFINMMVFKVELMYTINYSGHSLIFLHNGIKKARALMATGHQ